MSQTPQQLTYPVPLQIEWQNETFPDSTSGALIVRDPNPLLAKLGFQGTWQSHDGSLPTFAQFCEWMPGLMVQEINNQLKALEPLITSLTERLVAREKAQDEGQLWLFNQVNFLNEQLALLASWPKATKWTGNSPKPKTSHHRTSDRRSSAV